MNVVRCNYFGGGGRGWSQIKPITFENELQTYDMIPYLSMFLFFLFFFFNVELRNKTASAEVRSRKDIDLADCN